MNETKKRETSKTIEQDGRTFVINKYDPMTGNYIIYQLLTTVMPMGLGKAINRNVGSESLPEDTTSAKPMSKKDFIALQVDILSTVEEVMPTGHRAPIVRENGTYGVQDVTMGLLLKLLIASISFNFKDFFEESQLMNTLIQE